MKILIISDVPWCDDNSVGNTYSNIFAHFNQAEYANLYCKSGKPNSPVCTHYYQITEKKMLCQIFKRDNKKINSNKQENKSINDFNKIEQKVYDIARFLRFQSFFLLRELIWKIGRWKTQELIHFLDEFKPDLIFSFCLESIYYNNLVQYCNEYTNAKLILFFADDVYSFKKMNPIYRLYHYMIRKKMKELTLSSKLLYGATPMLCHAYSHIFQKNIEPLYKVCTEINLIKKSVNRPLIITYTGNLFYGRWKTLAIIAEAIQEINAGNQKVKLNIYSSGPVNNKIAQTLNKKGTSHLYGRISYEEVKNVLKNSDVVLHVESFEKKEIKKTKFSFSTKIVDCMQSGSCLFAVGPEKVASIKILKDHNIAQVITSKDKESIKALITILLNDKNIIFNTAIKMNQFAMKNFSISTLDNRLYKQLTKLVKEECQ